LFIPRYIYSWNTAKVAIKHHSINQLTTFKFNIKIHNEIHNLETSPFPSHSEALYSFQIHIYYWIPNNFVDLTLIGHVNYNPWQQSDTNIPDKKKRMWMECHLTWLNLNPYFYQIVLTSPIFAVNIDIFLYIFKREKRSYNFDYKLI
jgi:hypothetical protein